MTDNSFSNELERALARPDVATLRLNLEDYCHYMESVTGKGPDDWECEGNFNYVYDAHENPDVALAYVMLALSEYDDPHFLGVVAAGPLEDTLREPRPELIQRVVAEALRTPRFRWMLRQIYLPVAEWASRLLKEAAGDRTLDDPLPPRVDQTSSTNRP
jgi:hypothetical protein